jgi:hypothetical protein
LIPFFRGTVLAVGRWVIFFALIAVESCRGCCRQFALNVAGLKLAVLYAQAVDKGKLRLMAFVLYSVLTK